MLMFARRGASIYENRMPVKTTDERQDQENSNTQYQSRDDEDDNEMKVKQSWAAEPHADPVSRANKASTRRIAAQPYYCIRSN
jgi:hypothetical protein